MTVLLLHHTRRSCQRAKTSSTHSSKKCRSAVFAKPKPICTFVQKNKNNRSTDVSFVLPQKFAYNLRILE